MRDEEKYEQYARKIGIFNGLEPNDVAHILHHGKVHHFASGQIVFHEGALGSNLFIVLRGEIQIYRKDKPIARCHVGDAFGEMAVLNHTPRCATVAALTDVKLFAIDEQEINELLEKRIAVRILLNIIHLLSERLENANSCIARAREPVEAKG